MRDEETAATGIVTDPNAATVAAPASEPVADDTPLVEVDAAHFRVTEELARGGMGRIRVARDNRLGRWVALKEVLSREPGVRGRFEREVRITARLQHPSIMSVYEAGLLPSGEPFFAMPLVKGRSLDVVIAEKRTLAERLALVPNVLAVADAMAYAHGERVIHRDLKPGNVIVGSFGETVVIDWGIAKSIDAGPDHPSLGGSSDHGMATVDGAVIGTPAYMPPEQAHGSNVDERADVYSIGAMLAHVLTGAAPYSGNTAEVLAKLLDGPPVPVREREPNAPADLVAIVERAMARTREDRYPTARELAEDLRRFQTGQLVGAHRYSPGQLLRRWVKRHRTTLAVAGTLVALLIAGTVVAIANIVQARDNADEQRLLAEANRARANDFAQYMLTEMHERLAAIGRLDILDHAAQKAMSYYDHLDGNATDDERAAHAKAWANIGDVLRTREDYRGAREQYNRAIRELDSVAARPDRQLQVAAIHDLLGQMALRDHDLKGAARELDAEATLAATVLAAAPRDLAALGTKASALRGLADVARGSGDFATAKRDAEDALVIAEDGMAREPDDNKWVLLAAALHKGMAISLASSGDVDGAVLHARANLALVEQAAKRDPKNSSILEILAFAHAWLGNVVEKTSDREQALPEFRAAVAIYENRFAQDPSNTNLELLLAESRKAVGTALSHKEDYQGALVELRAAMPLYEDLVARSHDSPGALGAFRSARADLGDALLATDQPAAAVVELRASRDLADRVAVAAPNDPRARRTAALIRNMLGRALTLDHDPAAAIIEYQTALDISGKLLAEDPSSMFSHADAASAHRGLAMALVQQHHTDEAIGELRQAITGFDELARRDPHDAGVARELLAAHGVLAHMLSSGTTPRDAIAEYDAAIAIAKRVGEDTKELAAARAKLAR